MEPLYEQLEQIEAEYESAGEKMPDDVAEIVTKWKSELDNLSILSGDTDSVWAKVEEELAGDEDYQKLISVLEENGAYIPESIATSAEESIGTSQPAINQGISRMYDETDKKLQETFSKGFTTSTKVRLNFQINTDSNTSGSALQRTSIKEQYESIADTQNQTKSFFKHAEGGIFDTPHYGLFAEDGPEAFIPLDGSSNAISIWQQAGQMLGLGTSRDAKLYEGISRDSGQGNTFQINYTPSITIKGNASEEDVQNAVALGADDVVKIIKSYMGAQNRVSYKSRKR
jgi:hypothetical protein